MKTIINTKKEDSIGQPLVLSLVAHACLWAFCVQMDGRFEVAERFTEVLDQPHLTALDRFVTVALPQEPTARPEPVAAPAPQEKVERTKKKPRRTRTAPQKRLKRRVKRRKHVNRKPSKVSPLIAQVSPNAAPEKVSAPAQAAPVQATPVSTVSLVAHTPAPPPKVVQRRLSRSELRGLQRGYYSELNQIMRRERSYPRSARRRGLEGTVLVELIVDARGKLISASVVRSSGHDVLDRAALADVRKMKVLPRPPKELKRRKVKLHIPFEYSLQS